MGIRIGPNPPQFTPPERDEDPDEVERTSRTGNNDRGAERSREAPRAQVSDPGPAARVDISDQGRALAAQQAEPEPSRSQAPNQLPPPDPAEDEPERPTGL
jgi:hypothetical protein